MQLWEEGLRLQAEVEKMEREEKQYEMEMHAAQREWDRLKKKLEESRAVTVQKHRIKMENEMRYQREIRVSITHTFQRFNQSPMDRVLCKNL